MTTTARGWRLQASWTAPATTHWRPTAPSGRWSCSAATGPTWCCSKWRCRSTTATGRRALRDAKPGGWTPIIFLTGLNRDESAWRGIEAGGDDYRVKPISAMVLHAMQRILHMRRRLVKLSDELREANSQLKQLSQSDPLTGPLNRRALDSHLQAAIAHSRREQQPLKVMLCDIDFFKRYNDQVAGLQSLLLVRDESQRLRLLDNSVRVCDARRR